MKPINKICSFIHSFIYVLGAYHVLEMLNNVGLKRVSANVRTNE